MNNISKNLYQNISEIKNSLNEVPDLIIKNFMVGTNNVAVVFIETLIDSSFINDFILEYLSYEINYKKSKKFIDFLYTNTPTHKSTIIDDKSKIISNLLNGFVIVLVDKNQKCIGIEAKSKLSSAIVESANERTIQGPKDSFIENYQTNIGLIRKRLKTPKLKIKESTVGTLGNSKTAVIYIEDLADQNIVDTITDKINNINIEAVYDVQQIIELISANEKNVFPNYQTTERPDFVAQHLLNGRIAIILENTPFAAIIPVVANDFFHSPEDFYNRPLNATVNRIIRVIAFLTTLTLPAIYIAMTTYNHETIPPALLINFSTQRDGVPFSAIFEALSMILTFEILRETDIRAPSTIGNSLSIVGALVLGDAAVTAGIVSPIMVIVIAMTSISGLILTYLDAAYATRFWRIIFLIGAASSGFVGIVAVGFLFIANISSINSFGTPFLSGYAPLVTQNIGNNIFLTFKRKYNKKGARMIKAPNQKVGDI